MVIRTGGDLPDPINTETEYKGRVPIPNSVGDLGPEERDLSPAEKKRLGLLTGQDEDPYAPAQPAFMGGVDSNHPQHEDLESFIPEDYRSEGYTS